MTTHRLSLLLVWVGCAACRTEDKPSDADLSDTVDIPGTTDPGDTEPEDEPIDVDGDGYPEDEDCNDTNADVHPGADETCNGRDDDCDGAVDEDAVDGITVWSDADGDGFGATTARETTCAVTDGWSTSSDDCNDADASIHPGADERCDAIDHDCDGSTSPPGRFADFADLSGARSAIEDTGSEAVPQVVRIESPGTLHVCAGEFSARLELATDAVDVIGQGVDSTVLHGRDGTVVSLLTPGQQVFMEGLTITGGRGSDFIGGGISTIESWEVVLLLRDVRVTENHGTRIGAGIMVSGSLDATGLELSSNILEFDYAASADVEPYFNCEGAGAYVFGDVALEDSNVLDNAVDCHATGGLGAPRVWGGGLSVWGTLDLVDSRLEDNVARTHIALGYSGNASGGGAYVYAGSTIVGSVVEGNLAEVTGTCAQEELCRMVAGAGGASILGDSVLEDSLVTGNVVQVDFEYAEDVAIGGGLEVGVGDFVCTCTDPTSQDCGVYGNSALLGGGAWFASGRPPDATLTSEGCDWTGSQDNTPGDIAGFATHEAGDDANFFCADEVCE